MPTTVADRSAQPAPLALEIETETEGRRASALLNDPALVCAFARLENDIIAAWRFSPIDQSEAREWLYLRLAALAGIRDELRLMVEQGALAERKRLQHERDIAERGAERPAAGDPP